MKTKTTTAPEPCVLDPNAVFTLEAAREALGLARGTLPREVRLGRLKVSKRAGKYFITGRWILEWLERGVVTRRPIEHTTQVGQ